MRELIGVIPAAGRGVRAYPFTRKIPKGMLEVDGLPLVERNVQLMRDKLGIRRIRIVIGHHGEVIRQHLGDGAALGVQIEYVVNDKLDRELAYSVHLGCQGIESHACVILADECYAGTNHEALLAPGLEDALAVCTLIASPYAKHIRKNYTVTLSGDRITDMHEKPVAITGNLMGTGTYLLAPALIQKLHAAFQNPDEGPRVWTAWLAEQCRAGADVRALVIVGSYVNVNSKDDSNFGNYLVRELTFERKTTSLVYVVDDLADESKAANPVESFAERPDIDEVVVVTRRAAPSLEKAAHHPKVRTVVAGGESSVGALFTQGLDAATSDILLLSHSGDTFSPRDVSKLLVYLRDADMVVGTRTTRQMIEQGTNMRGIVRAAHIILAKMLEMLWWRFDCRFTDVCCVYRALWKSTYRTIRGNLTANGVELIPEMVIEVLRARRRIIEIPVNYYNRDLEFSHVHAPYQRFGTFLRIVLLMLRKRLVPPR